MAEEKVLEGIEKQCSKLARSNAELSAKLKSNQDVVQKFNDDVADLKSTNPLNSEMKKGLDDLRQDLVEKQALIARMMENLRPLEEDMARRDGLVNSLNEKISDQERKIESLSQDLLAHRKSLDLFERSNTILKEKVVEKEGTINILKEKLAHQVLTIKDLEEHNDSMASEIDGYKKEVFGLTNRFGAVEKRIVDVDNQNKDLMSELVASKERLRALEAEIDSKEQSVDALHEAQAADFERLRKEEERKRIMIMENHTKKVSILNAQLDSLKAQILRQQAALTAKKKKERELLTMFGSEMQELIAQKADVSVNLDTSHDADALDVSPEETLAGAAAEVRGTGSLEGYDISEDVSSSEVMSAYEGSRADEIVPMIDLGRDNGDSDDRIRQSLVSVGFKEDDINQAFAQLPILQKR